MAMLSSKPAVDGDEENDEGGFGASIAMMPLGAAGGVLWGLLSSFGAGLVNASPTFNFDAYLMEQYYGSATQAVRMLVMSLLKQGVVQVRCVHHLYLHIYIICEYSATRQAFIGLAFEVVMGTCVIPRSTIYTDPCGYARSVRLNVRRLFSLQGLLHTDCDIKHFTGISSTSYPSGTSRYTQHTAGTTVTNRKLWCCQTGPCTSLASVQQQYGWKITLRPLPYVRTLACVMHTTGLWFHPPRDHVGGGRRCKPSLFFFFLSFFFSRNPTGYIHSYMLTIN